MRKTLDKIFSNSKWCVLIPILVAMCIYLTYILFGNYNNKVDAVLALPIISVFWFFWRISGFIYTDKKYDVPGMVLKFV